MDIFNDDITLIEWMFIYVDGEFRVVGLVGGDHEYPIYIVSSAICRVSMDGVLYTSSQNVYVLNRDYPTSYLDKWHNIRDDFEGRMKFVMKDPRRNGFGREVDYIIVSNDELKLKMETI